MDRTRGDDDTEFANHSRLHILLAEDDANLRSMLAIVLRREGHSVQEFRNGGDLDAHLTALFPTGKSLPRDLFIVTDLRMPEMDGLTIIRALKLRGFAAPFILFTAFGSPLNHATAHDLGAVRVLDKPFDFEELTTAIRAFVRARTAI